MDETYTLNMPSSIASNIARSLRPEQTPDPESDSTFATRSS